LFIEKLRHSKTKMNLVNNFTFSLEEPPDFDWFIDVTNVLIFSLSPNGNPFQHRGSLRFDDATVSPEPDVTPSVSTNPMPVVTGVRIDRVGTMLTIGVSKRDFVKGPSGVSSPSEPVEIVTMLDIADFTPVPP